MLPTSVPGIPNTGPLLKNVSRPGAKSTSDFLRDGVPEVLKAGVPLAVLSEGRFSQQETTRSVLNRRVDADPLRSASEVIGSRIATAMGEYHKSSQFFSRSEMRHGLKNATPGSSAQQA